VVDVTDRSDVHVRLGPLELGLSHWVLLRTRLQASGWIPDAVRIWCVFTLVGWAQLRCGH
jgi:hypothetical protein